MIFDLLSLFTLLGLLVRGLKKGGGKLPLFVALGISAVISGGLVPVYMKFFNLPKDIPAGVISFIITFIFAYVIISVPTLIFSVIVGGIVIIFIYGIIVFLLPPNVKGIVTQNSKIYPVIQPLILQVMSLLHLRTGNVL